MKFAELILTTLTADAVAMLILATSASAQSCPPAAAPQRALDELADWGAQNPA